MKIECLKENLIHSISVAERITGKNLNLPVLGYLLLEVKNNTLKIHATNLDLGVEISIPVKTTTPGIVAVPGATLYNVILNEYNSNTLTLTLNGENLSISTPHSSTLIKSYPHEDFPTLPKIKEGETFTVKTEQILKGLTSVWFSASTSTIKPELASVYLYMNDKKMFFVATDSFRLSEKIILEKNFPSFEPILIPIRNVPEIIKVFEYLEEDEINVSLSENQISFSSNNIYLTSRLIDGVFPDYKQIIPKKFTSEVIVLKQDLLNTLKKINIFSNKFNQVQFHISPSKKKLVLSAQNSDVGETTNTLQASLTGEDLDINFNHKYITDALQVINSNSISLSFGGLGKPMVMRGVSDQTYLYLVMPMNR